MRLIVGVSGASGALLGYRTLQALRLQPECEVHLVMTEGALLSMSCETRLRPEDFYGLADRVYSDSDLAAAISSGSFHTDGMMVVPCSMKTLSAIANGYSAGLLARAADVCLKEGRRVVLVPRETPFSRIHLRNLQLASDAGCAILPPMLTFYNGAETLEEQMQHIVGKLLMQFGLMHQGFRPWQGG